MDAATLVPPADPLNLSAERLLAIPDEQAHMLFAGEPAAMRSLYQLLVARWHPDRSVHPAAGATFVRIRALFERALADHAALQARRPGTVEFACCDGRTFRLRYLRAHDFELGRMYVAQRHVAYRLDPAHQDLFDDAARTLGGLRFADASMRAQLEPSLPRIAARLETAEGPVLVLHKDPELVVLRDLLAHAGTLDPRHAAWILSGLHHLACWLGWARLSHGAIAADSVFVAPRSHAVALLGGWWYARPFGAPLAALPQASAVALPDALVEAGRADPRADLELIHALGRELVGDARGIGFLARPDVPQPLYDALRLPAAPDAFIAYRRWHSVLAASFGKRRFTALAVSPTAVYEE